MSDLPSAPVPLIPPHIIDAWSRIPDNQVVSPNLTKGDWDLILSSLLDMNAATAALATFSQSSAEMHARDWGAFQRYYTLNQSAHSRLGRFIETFMYKAANNV